MVFVSVLLVAIGLSASYAAPQDGSGAPISNSRCSKTMKYLYQPSGDGESFLGDYSWMVALGYQSKDSSDLIFRCGGMLIADRWIMTSAQCVIGLGNFELVKLRIGDLNLDPKKYDGVTPVDGIIDEIKVHPEYKVNSIAKDIALIRMKEPVALDGRIHPICLHSSPEFQKSEYYDRKTAFIMGWGEYKVGGGLSKKLLEGTVNTVEQAKCAEKYSSLSTKGETVEEKYAHVVINDEILCAGDSEQSACEGDVGGPMVFIDPIDKRHYLGGIISGIYKCGVGYPNLFTKVAAFIPWINEVTGEQFA